jgi:hypothetical protein
MRVFRWLLLAGSASAIVFAPVSAQESSTLEAPMDEIVVTGEFPGPGLWKVTRPGDTSGNTLWILGDPGPLPRSLTWRSNEIEATVSGAQEILFDSGVTIKPDEKVGIWRGLTLVPAALKARHNPDGAKLEVVLPPELYTRWLVQKKLYLGRSGGVETWRPMFAAMKLQQEAEEKMEPTATDTVMKKIHELVAKQKIKQTFPMLEYTVKRSEIRARMKGFQKEALTDVECFAVTLDLVEALARRDVENARSKAWARGDLAALRSLPELPNPDPPCTMAIMSSQAARDLVPTDIAELQKAKWLEAVGASLAVNRSTFAVLPFHKLIRKDGYPDLLRAKGYLVEEPG